MAKRRTRVVLDIDWDDEDDIDHPAGWDYPALMEANPFSLEGSHQVRLVSFQDIGDDNQTEQT